ncbi:hypothetical protein ACFC1W_07785 [Microbacterium sp. NPDC056003]|uniref:hypothetical protein n=1 Tax=Microbacterium sp. NPDC056003 TaxID=3345676 RepID=UPI0035DA4F03
MNDVVAYEAMRESATTLSALLLRSSADIEVRELRDAVVGVDGYDRAAVSALAAHIRGRIAELTESQT